MVGLYLAGAALPYLIVFTLHGTTHCSPVTGCRAPGDVFEGPLVWLVIPALLITILGPPVGMLSMLMSFTSLARRRRAMPDALRRWMYAAAGLTLAFIAFTLTPPGRLLLNWVLD